MISPVTIQKQIFDTRDDKKFIMMKIFKFFLGFLCLLIGLYLLSMMRQKPKEIFELIAVALFVYFGIMMFNKSLPFKIFML
jgi:putative Mn2+ efflux pump MntP